MRWAGKSISLGHKPPVFCNRTVDTLTARLVEDGILVKANDERDPDYLFLHRTFHEYLTARALLQDREALPDMCALLRNMRAGNWARGDVLDGLWKLAQAEKVPIRS